MNRIQFKASALSAILVALLPLSALAQEGGARHYAYIETNDARDNHVLVFEQRSGGQLKEMASVPTDGRGNGGSLGQGALALTADGHTLFAVNNGTNSISVFRVNGSTLTLLEIVSSGGTGPISIAENDGLVYVLNAGGATNNIYGFAWTRVAGLIPIPGSKMGLSTASPTPVQIGINPDASQVVVTENATNLIEVFNLSWDGRPSPAVVNKSAGLTPFGFAFDSLGNLLVSDANGGAAGVSYGSSYAIDPTGMLHPHTALAPTHQTAACWATTDSEGRYLYLADAGSNAITGFRILHTGAIQPLSSNGLTASTDPHPIDMASSKNDEYLYVLSNMGGAIDEYEIQLDGTLTRIGSVIGLPNSISGIVTK